jgi:hypothetical protein
METTSHRRILVGMIQNRETEACSTTTTTPWREDKNKNRRNKDMTSSFGRWYDDQRAAEGGGGGSNSSWFSVEQTLPLFNTDSLQAYTDGLQNISFDSMKQSMEAQMPKKILGMGYQQRFKVGPKWAGNISRRVGHNRIMSFIALFFRSCISPEIACLDFFRCFVRYCFFLPCFLPWRFLWACP